MNSKLSIAKLSTFIPVTDMQWSGFSAASYTASEIWAFHYARTDVADLRDYCAVDFESEIDAIEHIGGNGKVSILFRRAYLWRVYHAVPKVAGLDACRVFERLHDILAGISGLDALRCERMDDYVYARVKQARWEHICDQMYALVERIDSVMSREVASIHETNKPTLSSRTYYPVWLLAFLFDQINVAVRKKHR